MELLSKFPDEATIFVDANIFIYHFCDGLSDLAKHCTEFLLRVENEQVKAFTTTFVIAEVLHRAMIYESIEQTGESPQGALKRLQKNLGLRKKLKEYNKIPGAINDMGIQILPVSLYTIMKGSRWREENGLLVNDSIIIATMKHHNIVNLATNDSDFDQISNITIWKPSLK